VVPLQTEAAGGEFTKSEEGVFLGVHSRNFRALCDHILAVAWDPFNQSTMMVKFLF